MATIENKDFWDMRDLAELARDCGVEIDDPDTDAEDVQDSRETLAKLAELADELGQSNDAEDADSVADALEAVGDNMSVALIGENSFTDYCEEFVTDCGYLTSDTPSFLSNNINWDGVAEDLKVDYTEITFDGSDWLIR